MFRRLMRREAGDTIVEVLIAIAVISSVLAITYSIMSRNLAMMRDNQERTEAAKLAQGQLEALRARWATETGRDDLLAQAGTGFCIDTNGMGLPGLSGGAPNNDLSTDDFAEDYPAECVSNNIFHIGVKLQSDGLTTATYQVTVRWDALTGSRGQVIYAYMLEKD